MERRAAPSIERTVSGSVAAINGKRSERRGDLPCGVARVPDAIGDTDAAITAARQVDTRAALQGLPDPGELRRMPDFQDRIGLRPAVHDAEDRRLANPHDLRQ